MTSPRTAFALAGLGGNNAFGAGFLSAAQHVQRQRMMSAADGGSRDAVHAERIRLGILPELEFISCTSGAIATTATYLAGGDLQAEVETRIAEVQRITGLPRTTWTTPWRAPALALLTGVPGVFGPWVQAFSQHIGQWLASFYQPGGGWSIPTTTEELLDLLQPARAFVPLLPEDWFEQTAEVLNRPAHGVGVALNSFHPGTGMEHLYVNDAAMALIREHHNSRADYGRTHGHVTYQRITPNGLRAALWLFYYGFPANRAEQDQHIDGAYCRSIILAELTFADRIYAVTPVNHRWIGRLPKNLLEVQDMQTELWMGVSYREQARLIDTTNNWQNTERLIAAPPRTPGKRVHHIDLIPVEISAQRGFFTYFDEDMQVFRDAYGQSVDLLLSREHTTSNVNALPDKTHPPVSNQDQQRRAG